MTRCLSRGWPALVAITLLSTGPAARADDTHAAAKQRFAGMRLEEAPSTGRA